MLEQRDFLHEQECMHAVTLAQPNLNFSKKKKKKKAAKTLGLETLSETTPKTTLRKVTAINFLVNMHLVYFAIVGTGA